MPQGRKVDHAALEVPLKSTYSLFTCVQDKLGTLVGL